MAVFGPNGAGKTNLIEAVSLLSPGRGLRGAASEELARVPERLGWKVVAALGASDGPHEVATWSEGPGRRVEIDGKAASQTALGGVARVLWLTPAMDRLWLEGPGERRRFLDRVTLSLVPDHGEVAVGYDRSLRERNRLIRDDVRDAGWFEALEAQMAASGARLSANRAAALARLAAVEAEGEFPQAALSLEGEGPRDEAGLRDGAARRARARRGGGADAGRAAPRRPRGGLCREGGAGAALLDRRAEGAADQRGARQRPRGGRRGSARRRSCSSTRWPPISTRRGAGRCSRRSRRSGRRPG